MPKARVGLRTPAQNVKKTVICRCKTHCLTYNAATGKYDGSGERISMVVRAFHRRDDRLRALLRQSLTLVDEDNGGKYIHHLPSSDSSEANWLPLIRTQVHFMLEMQSVPVDKHLTFLNDPTSSGPYLSEFDRIEDYDLQPQPIPAPNTGHFALKTDKTINPAVLEAENCLWELHRTLQVFVPTEEVVDLHREVYEGLVAIDRQKQMHWETLRGAPSNQPYFNTGTFVPTDNGRILGPDICPEPRGLFPEDQFASQSSRHRLSGIRRSPIPLFLTQKRL